jgi:hypothetical protein
MTIQSIDSLTIVDPILGPSLTQLDARGCKRGLLLFDYFLNNAATRPSNVSGRFTKSDRIRVLVRVGTTPVGFEDSGAHSYGFALFLLRGGLSRRFTCVIHAGGLPRLRPCPAAMRSSTPMACSMLSRSVRSSAIHFREVWSRVSVWAITEDFAISAKTVLSKKPTTRV